MRRFNRDQEVNQSLMTMLLNHEETVGVGWGRYEGLGSGPGWGLQAAWTGVGASVICLMVDS